MTDETHISQTSDESPSRNTSQIQREDFNTSNREKRRKELEHLQEESRSKRKLPTPEEIERHQKKILIAKWALPAIAFTLLISIILWPEISHLVHENRVIKSHITHRGPESSNMEQAVYRGVDSHNRSYMITSITARQIGAERIDMDHPIADMHLSDGKWIEVRADRGTFMQDRGLLDLDGHVYLYRSDGLFINGLSTSINLNKNIIASPDWVHAEGPTGTQDAESFFMDQNRGEMLFIGPGRSLRNHDEENTESHP
ncbi:LPS export ABC transporter periplasmic protein LptC [Acetobacteraceae bacterium]|nr:LPS export ABC transporter periplasmic protein LptC [Acetobacteraceae bacterium]